MKVRVVVLCAVSALPWAWPAAAQRPGTIEVGGFARYTDFDNSLAYANKLGVGARIGVFLPARFAIEGDLSRTVTDGPTLHSIHHRPLHIMLEYNVPASDQADLVVGGATCTTRTTAARTRPIPASPGWWGCAIASGGCWPRGSI